jgi:tetratricopeptide (TPR) repeat protein
MALSHGWYDDAIRDLRASVESRPYSAAAHLWLGIAYLRAEEFRQWLDELERAVKYAAADGRQAGVTAAIIAANAYDGGDRRDLALAVLHAALRLGPCVSIAQAILL